MVDTGVAYAAEFLYESCSCDSGMRNGLRCADCGGRGIVAKGTKPTGAAVSDEAAETTVDDGLDDMSVTHLRSRAKDLGLPTGGSKAALVQAIREATAEVPDGDGDAADEADDNDAADDSDA